MRKRANFLHVQVALAKFMALAAVPAGFAFYVAADQDGQPNAWAVGLAGAMMFLTFVAPLAAIIARRALTIAEELQIHHEELRELYEEHHRDLKSWARFQVELRDQLDKDRRNILMEMGELKAEVKQSYLKGIRDQPAIAQYFNDSPGSVKRLRPVHDDSDSGDSGGGQRFQANSTDDKSV